MVLITVSLRLKVMRSIMLLQYFLTSLSAVVSAMYRGLQRRDTNVRLAWICYGILEVLMVLLGSTPGRMILHLLQPDTWIMLGLIRLIRLIRLMMVMVQSCLHLVMLLLAPGPSICRVVVVHLRVVVLVGKHLFIAGTVSVRFDAVFAGLCWQNS